MRLGDLTRDDSHQVAYRALIPMEEMVAKIGEKARKGTSKYRIGRHRVTETTTNTECTVYLGKDHHILTFPIQGGRTMNVVAFISDRSPASKVPEWPGESWIVPGSREEMLNGWEGWSEDCQKILQVRPASPLLCISRSQLRRLT